MKEFIRDSWQLKNVAYRGFSESDRASQVADVDGLLSNVARYSPPSLFRALELRCRSLSEVWDLIRSGWSPNFSLTQGSKVWDPSGSMTRNKFYVLRVGMQDTLLMKNG